mmetsp:Transcript_156/g.470  ORF Transcript_156/g.470 Transcript_156/m.470 type:complete len:200 (-) Transcript_156:678-1277(-)
MRAVPRRRPSGPRATPLCFPATGKRCAQAERLLHPSQLLLLVNGSSSGRRHLQARVHNPCGGRDRRVGYVCLRWRADLVALLGFVICLKALRRDLMRQRGRHLGHRLLVTFGRCLVRQPIADAIDHSELAKRSESNPLEAERARKPKPAKGCEPQDRRSVRCGPAWPQRHKGRAGVRRVAAQGCVLVHPRHNVRNEHWD